MKNFICALFLFISPLVHAQNVLENVLNYDWAADFDPRIAAINAPKGAVLKFAPAIGAPSLMQKQDNGLTTNWVIVAGGGIGTVSSITAGTGLTGGTISTVGTIGIGTTGVAAGSYGTTGFFPTFSVNAQGQITSAGSISTGGSFANQQLSNLSGTTAVNLPLIFNQGSFLDGASSISLAIATASLIDTATGNISLTTGSVNLDSGAGPGSGSVSITTGNIGASGNTVGSISLTTGNAHANTPGNIILNTGAGANKGVIGFQNGSQGTAGHVWTSVDGAGSGTWRPTSVIVQAPASTPTCGAPQDGFLALTSAHLLCVCNGSGFVQTSDGSTPCTF